VTWKAGVTPVLLVKDNQITSLAKAGKLTIKDPHIVLKRADHECRLEGNGDELHRVTDPDAGFSVGAVPVAN